MLAPNNICRNTIVYGQHGEEINCQNWNKLMGGQDKKGQLFKDTMISCK